MPELSICTSCFGLRGPCSGWVNPCRCDLEILRARGERHPRFGDLVTSAELCQCCTLEVLASGSKWSVWFCPDCRPRIGERNQAARRSVIPIGRHSMMNGVSLPADLEPDDPQVEVFAGEIGSMIERMHRLDAWARDRTRDNLDHLGLLGTQAVPVATYIEAAAANGLTKHDTVEDLLLAFTPAHHDDHRALAPERG